MRINKMKKYRKCCKALSESLKVPEILMSAKTWSEIDFKNVPSICLHKFEKAFLNEKIKKERFVKGVYDFETGKSLLLIMKIE